MVSSHKYSLTYLGNAIYKIIVLLITIMLFSSDSFIAVSYNLRPRFILRLLFQYAIDHKPAVLENDIQRQVTLINVFWRNLQIFANLLAQGQIITF